MNTAFTLVCGLTIGVLLDLANSWYTVGYGLHPLISLIASVFLIAAPYLLATIQKS